MPRFTFHMEQAPKDDHTVISVYSTGIESALKHVQDTCKYMKILSIREEFLVIDPPTLEEQQAQKRADRIKEIDKEVVAIQRERRAALNRIRRLLRESLGLTDGPEE